MISLLDINAGSWNSDDWALVATIAITLISLGGFGFLIRNLTKEVSKLSKIDPKILRIEGRVAVCETHNKTLDKTLDKITGKIDKLLEIYYSKSNSPRILNERGIKILSDSKVMKIIEPKMSSILEQVRAMAPKNAYQAEKAIISVVTALSEDPTNTERLEIGAFESGENIETVLMVAALHIRDSILTDLGMNSGDIDLGDN